MAQVPLPISHAVAGAPSNGSSLRLDPRTYDRALSCVHCGLCLPACPTYTETGHEADSPRGRIQLMRGLADGVIEPTESVREHLDLCLDCRACETACPSGVVYHELIEETRNRLGTTAPTLQGRLMRGIFFNLFIHPTRLKLALLPARVMQKIGLYGLMRKTGVFRVLPPGLRKMEQMLPERGKLWPTPLPERVAAKSERKATVGFVAGCIGSVMFEKVNRQAVELLSAAGAEVVVPKQQTCCGAIHHHNGVWEPAKEYAKRNIDLFIPEDGPPAVDHVTCTIAGCGAMLHEYDHLLRDDPKYAERAKEFSRRAKDVSELLVELGVPEAKHRVERTVTYHEACHLVHAQKVSASPKKLLAMIPGLTVVPLPEGDMCCGAAGTYNLQHPAMATQLAERKLRHVRTTGAATCVTGNVGCAMHIQSEATAKGKALEVVHPVELLHEAVFGK